MKVPLCAALALHAAVLLAAARWTPAPQVEPRPLELGAAREIPVDAPPPPPPRKTVEADEITLPRRVIAGVVARSAGRLRLCYEDGLRREPDLAGQIPVRFSVDVGGSVLVATDGGSTVTDPAVVRCVLSAFTAMSFPARGRGDAVRATYLVAFPPG